MDIGQLKEKMLQQAKQKHGAIAPCGLLKNIEDGFRIYNDKVEFWYNDVTINSTHLIVEKIK